MNEKKNNQNLVQSILFLYHDGGTLSDTDVEVACRLDCYRVRDKRLVLWFSPVTLAPPPVRPKKPQRRLILGERSWEQDRGCA